MTNTGFPNYPISEIRNALGRLFEVSAGAVEIVTATSDAALVLAVDRFEFAVEYASSSAIMPLRPAIERLAARKISRN